MKLRTIRGQLISTIISWVEFQVRPSKSWFTTLPKVNPWQTANSSQNINCIVEVIRPAFLALRIRAKKRFFVRFIFTVLEFLNVCLHCKEPSALERHNWQLSGSQRAHFLQNQNKVKWKTWKMKSNYQCKPKKWLI